MMIAPLSLEDILSTTGVAAGLRREVFAFVVLGVLDSLEKGLLSPDDASRTFFTFDNCQFVKTCLESAAAESIMGRGVQLADLFEALPEPEARRGFAAEINSIREECFRILERERCVA